jgi:hypothetical protein
MKLHVFYHLYIPADIRYTMWTWWVDEHMGIIKSSGLNDFASVNICITMPVNFETKIPPVNFAKDVFDYINKRYPFVNIVNVRDTSEFNMYEGQTLHFLYETCLREDCYVLYLHSKGITSMQTNVVCWRQMLNKFLIEDWQDCVDKLHDVDVVGVKDASCHEFAVSGNFWWAKSDYIKTLSEPLDSTKYQTRESFYPGNPDYRYSFEDWLWFGKPRIKYVFDSKIKHYEEMIFVENIGR